jgi:hypothetical protein
MMEFQAGNNRMPACQYGKTGVYIMGEILIFIGIIGVWYLLQAYVLPKMGVST